MTSYRPVISHTVEGDVRPGVPQQTRPFQMKTAACLWTAACLDSTDHWKATSLLE